MRRGSQLLLIAIAGILAIATGFAQSPPRELEGRFSAPDTSVELRWNAPHGDSAPASYNIYRRNAHDSTIAFGLLSNTTALMYDDHAVELGHFYAYYVTAVYAGSMESGPSNPVIVRTSADSGGGIPLPPRELSAEFDTSGFVALDWQAPGMMSNPSMYKVYRGTGSPMALPPLMLLGSTTATEFNDSTVLRNTHYFYFVTAVYGTMQSLPSNFARVYTGVDSTGDTSNVQISFTTEPVRMAFVGQPYSYDADVVTVPPDVPVCFRLDDHPEGMTVNSSTGLVEWTPSAPGIYEVELKARACAGSDHGARQEYHIFVLSGKPGSIAGLVQNSSGNGLAHVRIKLFDVNNHDFVMRTTTDSTGHYVFPIVNPSTYFVRAKPEDETYKPQWYDGARRIEDATPVIVPESTSVTVNFTLLQRDTVTNRFQLSGTVSTLDSLPIAGAKVLIFRADHDSVNDDQGFDDHGGGQGDGHGGDGSHGDGNHGNGNFDDGLVVVTGSDGSFHVTLHAGTYFAGARAEGFRPQFYDHKSTPLEATPIMLTGNVDGINFNLAPRPVATGSIAGSIRNASDSSGLRSHVMAFQKDSSGHCTGFVASTRSDSSGAYLLDHVPAGFYIVLAKAHGDFLPGFYNTGGGTPFLDSATIVPVSTGPVSGIDIYLTPDSVDGLNSIVGTIHANDGRGGDSPAAVLPAAGAIVIVSDAVTHQPVASAVSLGDGSYAATGVGAGSFVVTFQKPGQASASSPVDVSYSNNTPTTATVNAQMGAPAANTFLMSIRRSWNLVSVPYQVPGTTIASVYPGATSPAFSFNASGGYQSNTSLTYGTGYWLKFPANQAVSLGGTPRTTQSVPLESGWNLVGSLSGSVPLASVSTIPSGILAPMAYAYDGGYVFSQTIEPGKGYWIKSSSAGTLTMNATAMQAKGTQGLPAGLEGLNSLTIRDAVGNSQTLYFGARASSGTAVDYEMPPPGPADAFDVRFASQHLAALYDSRSTTLSDNAISLSGAQGQVTIMWSVKDVNALYRIVDGSGKPLVRNALTGIGSAVWNSPAKGTMTLRIEPSALPKEFALLQNYPNPFNPSTTIRFDLPVTSNVTLKVYNLIGQEVATLISNQAIEAGQHQVRFDASSASGGLTSGVYFYKLQTGGSVHVRKMMLVK